MDTNSIRPQSGRFRWLVRALWVLALAGLVYLAGLTVWLGGTGLFFPYQLDYGEGAMLHFVKEWSQGRPIYRVGGSYPYISANYAPLTMVLALALTPGLGLTYTVGRLWTLVAIGLTAALIVAWVRRESGRWLPAAAAALLFAGSPYIYHWAPLFRVDLVGLALTLGGLYTVSVATRLPQGGRRRRLLWLATALFVAGLYAKQSFFFAPAAALAYLFLSGDRQLAIKMALAMGIVGGGAFLLINALTGGGFWWGLVASNVNPFLWPEFWKQLADFFGTFAILTLLAAWYVVDKFLLPRSPSPPSPAARFSGKASPLDLYLLAALASLWLAGKAGAWENYFFEALAALVLCAGLGIARLLRRGRRLALILAPALLLAQVGLMWHSPRVASNFLDLTRQSNEEMAPLLDRTPDPIISEDMGLLVTNDKILDYYSFQYSQLARVGRWDQAWELDQLRRRRLSMVILEQGTRLDVDRYQRFTRPFLSELDRNYGHVGTVGKYELYVPSPLAHERPADFGRQLAIVGWSLDAPSNLRPGDALHLTVVWQAQRALDTDYTAFAHLVNSVQQGWGGDDHPPYNGLYPTSAWGAGEMVRDSFTLTVPTTAPPGLYDIFVGWYDPATQERLPVGEGNALRVAVLPLRESGAERPSLERVNARFGESITLEGYSLQEGSGSGHLTLRWSTETALDADYSVFVHLVDPAGSRQPLAQADGPPLGGRWPTTLWLPGVPVDDGRTIFIPLELAPGTYDLLVGLYDPATGNRLPLPDGSDALQLAQIQHP